MIGGIMTAAGAGLELANTIAEKSKNQQLIDAGEAQALVEIMGGINEKLQSFQRAAVAADTDPEFAKRVSAFFTEDD